jgi:signal recognition particle receptor subunit beta
MVSINYSAREVCCKIVYYGPGLSGKTTNLQYVHAKVPQNTRGKLISLATEADRTLYFDFLPINIGTINGFTAKFQLYTVPGQVYYNATRKLVLRGVDGVVFVADSQPDKMDENIESLTNLEENLLEYGYNLDELPMVIQYNKRDLPGVLPVDALNARLNPRRLPCFEASASIGNGVFDTLKLVIKLVLEKAKSVQAPGSAHAQPAAATQPRAVPVAEPVTEAVPAYPSARSSATTPQADPAPQPIRVPAPVSAKATSQFPAADPCDDLPVAVPPLAEPLVMRDAHVRPYPGSRSHEHTSPRPSAPIQRPTHQREPVDQFSDQDLSGPAPVEISDTFKTSASVPHMAPSVRRRQEPAKRGFFKRLFGIK